MSDDVSLWIEQLASGDENAARLIWERYSQPMLALARSRLGVAGRRAADEEDIVVSAFHSLCHRVEKGEFPDLQDRTSLWKLLTTIVSRKAAGQLRKEGRIVRGKGRVRGESVFLRPDASSGDLGFANLPDGEPTPAFAAEMVEQCSRLLAALPDDCRQVAIRRLEGYSNDEIAVELTVAPRTIERKLAMIRSIWRKESSADV